MNQSIRWGLIFAVSAVALHAGPAERQLETVRTMMLRPVWETIRENYYDPNFGGVDIGALEKGAERQLAGAKSLAEALSIIAQSVENFGDSHTSFMSPPRPFEVEYGWALDIAGRNVVVGAVEPGSDAEKKGVRPGEQVLRVNGMPATRDTLNMIRYSLNALNPQPGIRAQLQWHDGSQREVEFAAKVTARPQRLEFYNGRDRQLVELESEKHARKRRSVWQELGPGVLWWKLAGFSEIQHLEKGLRQAAGYEHVILDLRGNPGGLSSVMLEAIGAFFPKKTTIGTIRLRHKTEPLEASSRHSLRGKLYVLIDGGSASASEVLARTIQLTERGLILGDRSAGKVNRGLAHNLDVGPDDNLILFGVSVTNAAILMTDGQPLEKIGVTPEVWLVPSPLDLAEGNDPVLAAAAKLAGITLSKQDAGAISRRHRPPIFD